MSARRYPSIIQALFLVLLTMGLQFLTGILLETIPLRTTHELLGQLSPGAANLVAFSVVIYWGVKRSSFEIKQRLWAFNIPATLILALVFTIIGLHIILSEIDNLLQLFLPMPEGIADFFFQIITDSHILTAVVTLIIIAPLTEEILFRGVILEGFLGNYSTVKSMFLSSLLFALLHLNPWQLPHAFVLGLFFAYLYVKTRSLLLCILGHALNNGLPLLLMRSISAYIDGYSPVAHRYPVFQPFWLDFVGLIFLLTGLYFTFISFPHAKDD